MEWVLQVVDEFDDCLGALRFKADGFAAELGQACLALGVVALILVTAWSGAISLVLSSAIGSLGCAAILKTRRFVIPSQR